jgi:hypothetical protein
MTAAAIAKEIEVLLATGAARRARVLAVLEAVSRAHLYRKPVPESVVLEARTLLVELHTEDK